MLVTLENNQLFTKLGNQQAIPMFPESRTMFFPKVVNAEIEFTKAYAPRDERLDSPLGLARMARRPRRGR